MQKPLRIALTREDWKRILLDFLKNPVMTAHLSGKKAESLFYL